jgi:outer membrane receptor protein involved in Fe transport
VTRDAALFFAYGHFYQMPGLGEIFKNADYSVLSDLQAGTSDYGRVMGNPDIRPEQTVQYQFGYKHALTDWLGLDVNAYYKDIRDLLGVEFVSTYNDAEYSRLANADFGRVIGLTAAVEQRARGLLSTRFDYTWQLAQGNSSDPRETATRAASGEDPRPRQVPLDWDQRHTLNVTVTLARPDLFSASAVVRAVSGQPYTPATFFGSAFGLEKNAGRKPNAVLVDLRGERQLRIPGLGVSAFARVFNLFDARFFNGFVFSTSGSPYYSRFDIGDRAALADPTRFYAPRRVELGVTLRASAAGGER